MIPRGLLKGTPIEFSKVRAGDIIDTYSPDKEDRSRFHRRFGQRVLRLGMGCDIDTDYDMICKHLGLWIQLRHRPQGKDGDHEYAE